MYYLSCSVSLACATALREELFKLHDAGADISRRAQRQRGAMAEGQSDDLRAGMAPRPAVITKPGAARIDARDDVGHQGYHRPAAEIPRRRPCRSPPFTDLFPTSRRGSSSSWVPGRACRSAFGPVNRIGAGDPRKIQHQHSRVRLRLPISGASHARTAMRI